MSATTVVSAPRPTVPNGTRTPSRGLQSAGPNSSSSNNSQYRGKKGPKPEPKTLFQSYFKSIGSRTYAAQIKEAGNGNHFLVLTEGKRDDKTGDVKKIRLFLFSEDFDQFKNLLRDAFKFIADHPLPPEVQKKREKFWQKKRN